MSLPASLTTDCGELLNRRSPGRKRCCHTEALHAGYHVYSSHEFSFCPELSNYRIGLFSHGESRRVTVLLSRIIELVYFHTEHRGESRDLCHELSNLFSHGESRRVTGFMSRIIELSNLFSHGRLRRFSLSRDMFLVTNLRISFFHTDCCGWSRRL